MTRRAGALALLLMLLTTSAADAVVPPAALPPAESLTASARWIATHSRVVATGARPARPVHPVDGAVGYGEAGARFGAGRSGHVHAGQDVFAPAGTPLVAVRDSVVVETGSDGGRGNYAALYAPGTDETYLYLHMLSPASTSVGGRLKSGQPVGALGCTGSCFGDHLHFEIRAGRGTTGPAVDPLPALLSWSQRR
jgi:murein DD-endopeptidase MepM/ murein hydrolase activator NlpD